MNMSNPKVKLTLTIDEAILDKSKRAASERRIPLSRLVENFLKFVSDPEVYCFKCGRKFNVLKAEICPKCGWLQCPECGACRCGLGEETAIAVFQMRRVYEELLGGRVK